MTQMGADFRQEEGSIQRGDAEGAEVRGEDGHPGLGVGKLDAWGRWLVRVVGPKSETFGPGWVALGEGVFSATSKAGETMLVRRVLRGWEVVVTRGAGFSLLGHADECVSVEAAQLMALEMALVMQVGCEGWAAEKARFFEAWGRATVGPDGEVVMPGEGTTEHTENTQGKEGCARAEAAGFERGAVDGVDEVDVEEGLPVPEVVLSGGAGFGDVYPSWLWERVPAREVVAVAEVLEGLAEVARVSVVRQKVGDHGASGLEMIVRGIGPRGIEINNAAGESRVFVDGVWQRREGDERPVGPVGQIGRVGRIFGPTESGQGQRDAGGTGRGF